MRSTLFTAVLLGLVLLASACGNSQGDRDRCRHDRECAKHDFCDREGGRCAGQLKVHERCERDRQCRSGACRDVTMLGPQKRMCIHVCGGDDDCPSSMPVCLQGAAGQGGQQGGQAFAFSSSSSSSGGGPRKDITASSGGQGAEGMCVECRADMDCSPKEHCQYGFRPDAFTCVKGKKCKAWSDCGPQEFCDFQTGRCRAWGLGAAEAAGQGGSTEY